MSSCPSVFVATDFTEMMRDLSFSRRRKFEFFWFVTLCDVMAGYQRLSGPCYHEDGRNMNF
jgi:hypothetical protein